MHPKSAPSRPLANAQAAYPSFDQRQRVLEWLDEQVPKSRVEHILRVEDMSIALAEHHGVSAYKAAQAGLMHDLAKYFKPKRLLELAIADGLDLDPVYRENPRLLHADVGAIVARDEFGVKDGDVLRAIANHTLGTPGMDTLSCIVFLADSLEPGRGDSDDLHHLRTLSFQDLKRAVWMTCDYTIQHLLRTKKLIHPRAIATRNWFLQNAKKHDLASSTKK